MISPSDEAKARKTKVNTSSCGSASRYLETNRFPRSCTNPGSAVQVRDLLSSLCTVNGQCRSKSSAPEGFLETWNDSKRCLQPTALHNTLDQGGVQGLVALEVASLLGEAQSDEVISAAAVKAPVSAL